jgi:hypothetical protein
MHSKALLLSALLGAIAVTTSAQAATNSITVTDGTGNTYGNATGIGIDFSSTLTVASWSPSLTAGLQYAVNSVSVRDASDVAGAVYLGVYTGNSLGVFTGFLGASTNSIDFSTVTNGNFAQFDFSGINVTADSAPVGSGLLYFGFQTANTDSGNALVVRAMHRVDGFDSYTIQQYGNNVLAFGALQTTRALEYQASVTAVPEPSTYAIFIAAFCGVALFLRRRKA